MLRQNCEGEIVKLNLSLPEEVEAALQRYRPRASHSPTMATLFPQVRDHIISAVRATRPQLPVTARARMSFVAWYATWLVEREMWEPGADQALPFTDETVDTFVEAAREAGYGSPSTLKSQLTMVGRTYIPEANVDVRQPLKFVHRFERHLQRVTDFIVGRGRGSGLTFGLFEPPLLACPVVAGRRA